MASLPSTTRGFSRAVGRRPITGQCALLTAFSGKIRSRTAGALSRKLIPSFLSRGRVARSMITLGLNYSQMHDSSACLVKDGELLFAVAEERISRVKHDARFPALAIQACLDFAKISSTQVDEVCVGWQPPGAAFRRDLNLFATGRWPASYLNVLNATRHFASMQHQHGGR